MRGTDGQDLVKGGAVQGLDQITEVAGLGQRTNIDQGRPENLLEIMTEGKDQNLRRLLLHLFQ